MSNELKIKNLLADALKTYHFSGYQLRAECGNKTLDLVEGKTAYWGDVKDIHADTFFDLGSLTKTILTTSCLARAVDRNELKLEATLQDFVPAFAGTPYAKMAVSDLLAHCSGLKGWMPLYETLGKQTLIDWFVANAKNTFESTARKKAIYSDLGFMLLGCVLDKIWGSIEKAFSEEVIRPLELKAVQFSPLKRAGSIAATEYCLYRKRLLCGEVFDENTSVLNGKSSHAGLFASAEALVPWCREWLKAVNGESDWLGRETANLFTRASGLAAGSTWAYGFDTRSKVFSSAGDHFSLKSFGGLGYPGCSIWMDPEAKGFSIFLTNRIHPSRFDDRIRKVRPVLHDEIARMWKSA